MVSSRLQLVRVMWTGSPLTTRCPAGGVCVCRLSLRESTTFRGAKGNNMAKRDTLADLVLFNLSGKHTIFAVLHRALRGIGCTHLS